GDRALADPRVRRSGAANAADQAGAVAAEEAREHPAVTPAMSDAGTQPGAAGGGEQPAETESVAALSVVRGEPTAEELAALVAVIASRGTGGESGDESAAP